MSLTDNEILAVCQSEIDAASGYSNGELAEQRADAMDRYLGEPYGDEVEGRSQFLTREVLEAIEGILPSLCRIFCEEDNMVVFEATGPEDEQQAAQESDTVNYIYWSRNRGFYNTYSFLKDALLSKTGILKCWVDKTEEEEREEYENIDDIQLGELMEEEGYEREVLEYDLTEDGHHVVFKTTRKKVKICIEPVPPEEFGVNRDARSPYAKDCQFVYQRARKSYSDLIKEGYDKKLIDSLPSNDDVETEERLARRYLDDEQESLDWANEKSMRMFWITECYVKLDRDDDGIAELLKVTLAAGAYTGAGARLMDIEEVDRIPFVTASPNIITHKFYGLSIADLTMDIQQIQTILNRQILDNTYLANNGQTAVNTDFVNLDDLLTKRPGGVVRYEGSQPWNSVVGPIPHNQLPAQTFEILERMDERVKGRVGYADEVAGLDANGLANVNTGVAALAFDMARMKIEQIARIFAELAFKPLFHDIHELLQKHQDIPMTIKLRGEWVPVKPTEWRTRENSTVQVGIGNVSRERRIMGYEAIMDRQEKLVAGGAMGVLVQPEQMFEAHKGWTKAWGFEPQLFFQDPRQLPPPAPKQPGPQDKLMEAQAQALVMDGQSKMQRNQIDAAKLRLEAQKQEFDSQTKEAEMLLKVEIEKLKSDLNVAKADADVTGKVRSIEAQRGKDAIEIQLKAAQMRLDELNTTKDRELNAYKMQMDHYVKLLELHNVNYDPAETERREYEKQTAVQAAHEEREHDKRLMGELHANLVSMTEKLGAMEAKANQPKVIKRTKDGLIESIGGQSIIRDDSGKAVQIG